MNLLFPWSCRRLFSTTTTTTTTTFTNHPDVQKKRISLYFSVSPTTNALKKTTRAPTYLHRGSRHPQRSYTGECMYTTYCSHLTNHLLLYIVFRNQSISERKKERKKKQARTGISEQTRNRLLPNRPITRWRLEECPMDERAKPQKMARDVEKIFAQNYTISEWMEVGLEWLFDNTLFSALAVGQECA